MNIEAYLEEIEKKNTKEPLLDCNNYENKIEQKYQILINIFDDIKIHNQLKPSHYYI